MAPCYLPARSSLDVDGGFPVPQHGQVFLGEMHHGENPGGEQEDPLPALHHTGRVLHTTRLSSRRALTGNSSHSHRFPRVVVEGHDGSSDADEESLPANDAAVVAVHVLGHDADGGVHVAL